MSDETSAIVRTDAVLWEETLAKDSEKLRELERIARGNGYWNHIEPFVAAFALKSAILTCEREKWEKRARKLLRNRKALRAERDTFLEAIDAAMEEKL